MQPEATGRATQTPGLLSLKAVAEAFLRSQGGLRRRDGS